MKGLIISPDFYNDKGGLETQIRELNKYLNFDILSNQKGCNYYFTPTVLDTAYCNKFIRKGNYETILVMCNDSRLGFICGFLKGLKVKKVLSISTSPDLFFERLSNLDVNNILNNFSSIRVQLKDYAPSYKNKKVFIIPNLLTMYPKDVVHSDILVTSVNMPTENKGLSTLEEAMSKVDMKLYTYGNFTLNGDNIHSFPFTDNKDTIYNNKLAYISTSYHEGMSNSVLEALSYGLPVIARKSCTGANFGASLMYGNVQELVDCLTKIKNKNFINYDITLHKPENIIPLWKDVLSS